MRRSSIACLTLLASLYAAGVAAQSDERETVLAIRTGDQVERLGQSGSGGDAWMPLFFGVDAAGSLHFPDFAKNRMAVFGPDGAYKLQAAPAAGLSPRMNYFDLAPDGSYVLFNDGTLSRSAADGTLLWQAPFPLGVIPSAILCGDAAVYFSVPSSGGDDFYLIPYAAPFTATKAPARGKKPAALLRTGGKDYSYRLSDMGEATPGFDTTAAEDPAATTLIRGLHDGSSLWRQPSASGVRILHLSATGKLVSSTLVAATETGWRQVRVSRVGGKLTAFVLSLGQDQLNITRKEIR